MATGEAPNSELEIRTFSKDQLILSRPPSERALRLLTRAEDVGLGGMFESHWLSNIRLTRDTRVLGWDRKPNVWYWEQIENGSLSENAARLPGVEILIDTTRRPNYRRGGTQLHKNDPLAPFMARLRMEGKIPSIGEDIPETSRFWIPPEPELTQVFFPEILKLFGVDALEVRFPTQAEFSILEQFIYPHFGDADTWEFLNDKFKDGYRLNGGPSAHGGLSMSSDLWSDDNPFDDITFRPLVVVSPKA